LKVAVVKKHSLGGATLAPALGGLMAEPEPFRIKKDSVMPGLDPLLSG